MRCTFEAYLKGFLFLRILFLPDSRHNGGRSIGQRRGSVLATDRFSVGYYCDVCAHVCVAASVGSGHISSPGASGGSRGRDVHAGQASLARHHEVGHVGIAPVKGCPFTWDIENHEPQGWIPLGHPDHCVLV